MDSHPGKHRQGFPELLLEAHGFVVHLAHGEHAAHGAVKAKAKAKARLHEDGDAVGPAAEGMARHGPLHLLAAGISQRAFARRELAGGKGLGCRLHVGDELDIGMQAGHGGLVGADAGHGPRVGYAAVELEHGLDARPSAAGLEDPEVVGREPLPEGKGAAGFQGRGGSAPGRAGIDVDDHVGAGHEALHGAGRLVGDAVAFAHAQVRLDAQVHVEKAAGTRGAHAQAAHLQHAGKRPDGLFDGALGLGGAGVHEEADGTPRHVEAGLEDDESHDERGHGVGLGEDVAQVRRRVQPVGEPDGKHADEDHGRGEDVGGEVEGVGLERLAFGGSGGLSEGADAAGVHKHGDGHDADAPERGQDGLAALHEAVHALPAHVDAHGEEQDGFSQGGEVFGPAVAVGVSAVGRPGGQEDGVPGHDRGHEVEPAVQGFGKDGQAVGVEADGELEGGEKKGRQQAQGGGPALHAVGFGRIKGGLFRHALLLKA